MIATWYRTTPPAEKVKGISSVYTVIRLINIYPGFMVINTAHDILIRSSLPSSRNLKDSKAFIKITPISQTLGRKRQGDSWITVNLRLAWTTE